MVTCFSVPQARFMLMLVMLRYTFLSGHSSQFCVTDNEAITLMFLFPISLRSIPKWPSWHIVLMVHIFTEANANIIEINRVNIELKACSQSCQPEPKQSFWSTPAVTSSNCGIGLMCDRPLHDQVCLDAGHDGGKKTVARRDPS